MAITAVIERFYRRMDRVGDPGIDRDIPALESIRLLPPAARIAVADASLETEAFAAERNA